MSIDVEISLNVESTAFINDNNEQIDIQLVVELVRIASVVQV